VNKAGGFFARFFRVNLVVCFDSILPKYTSLQHPSIVESMREMEVESEKSFVFQNVTEQNVEKIVNNISISILFDFRMQIIQPGTVAMVPSAKDHN
jgi:hypothetical protein